MKNEKFYDEVSIFYDEMISFNKSLENRINIFKTLLALQNRETVADVGCGSGLDTIALSKLGYNVTGFDPSKGMIEKAKKNAAKHKVKPLFKNSGINKPGKDEYNKYDLVLSLGNAFANIDPELLSDSLKGISAILKKNGLVFIQILNYSKILKDKKVVIGLKNDGDNSIIRFYDFMEKQIGFNILKVHNINPEESSLFKTILYPYKSSELVKLLKQNGFCNIKKYGSLKLEKYEPGKSKDLIIIAAKK